MELNLQTITNEPAEAEQSGMIEIADTVFNTGFKPALIHQVVTACLAGARAGTHAQKNRSQVNGGGAKPWRQKGTGRARAGTSRSPIWRGGGVTFAARPADYSQKVNKKMYRGAMRSILSELVRQDRLVVTDNFELNEAKTRELIAKLSSFGDVKILIVIAEDNRNLELAARNLHKINVVLLSSLESVDLVNADKVITTVDALRKIEGLWRG
jgi:large subunit ribosomal protein L4